MGPLQCRRASYACGRRSAPRASCCTHPTATPAVLQCHTPKLRGSPAPTRVCCRAQARERVRSAYSGCTAACTYWYVSWTQRCEKQSSCHVLRLSSREVPSAPCWRVRCGKRPCKPCPQATPSWEGSYTSQKSAGMGADQGSDGRVERGRLAELQL